MIISWEWIREYVDVAISPSALADRLAMAGLNHESTSQVDDDLAIDLEVTSNRPDCLGHIGIAREITVLTGQKLKVPDPRPTTGPRTTDELVRVSIECPDLCPRYTARVIQGVTIGPSPEWLVRRLRTIGVQSVNNVVDITNYVMFESGQPLHAFDYARLAGSPVPTILVRRARAGESFTAIDHREYRLEPDMCMIADARGGVAIGGVMGGAESEVSPRTKDVLIEAADFLPLGIRGAARKLNLHSPASHRFERGVDREGIEWASRRCCELILKCAGGTLATGIVEALGKSRVQPQPIPLAICEIPRLLGIEIDVSRVRSILVALGLKDLTPKSATNIVTFVPPSWRPDLTRDVDLIEELARIHGYDKIPEDAPVPMTASVTSRPDRVLQKVRQVLVGTGCHEAMTASVVSREWNDSLSPWSDIPPLRTLTPLLRGADTLRRSLIPSLLHARSENENSGNTAVELFEVAKVYLPRPKQMPSEPWMLSIVSEQSFAELKGILEAILRVLRPDATFDTRQEQLPFLDPARTGSLHLDGRKCAVLGQCSNDGCKRFELQRGASVAELCLDQIVHSAILVSQHVPTSTQPAVERDLNLILNEGVLWSSLRQTVRQRGGNLLEAMEYRETYRDPEKDGPGKKRVLFSLRFRAPDRTLTGSEVDAACQEVLAGCLQEFGAKLLA